MRLDMSDALDLLTQIFEAEREEKLFVRWVVSYQTTMTYEDFKNKLNQASYVANDKRSAEDILEDVASMLEEFGG